MLNSLGRGCMDRDKRQKRRLEHPATDPRIIHKDWAAFIQTLLKRDGIAIYRRLVEVRRTLRVLYAQTSQIENPDLAAAMRQNISYLRVCIEMARIRGVMLVQGM